MHKNTSKVLLLFFSLFLMLAIILLTPPDWQMTVTLIFGFCLLAAAFMFLLGHIHSL